MTTERPNVSLTGHYPIAKAAQVLGIDKRTLRRWIKCGNFKPNEYKVARYGHKGVFLYGRSILRVWEASENKKNNYQF